MRVRTGIVALVVMAVAVAGGQAVSRQSSGSRAPLGQALTALPANTRIAGFTDWARIRDTLGFDATAGNREAFIAAAIGRDYTARSVLADFAGQMAEPYGWSVDDLRWEMYGQASSGSIVVAAMAGGLHADSVIAHLRALGYREDGGVWSITTAAVAPGLPDVFDHVGVDADQRLIFLSDSARYLNRVRNTGRDHSLAAVAAAARAAEPLRDAQAAVLSLGRDACAAAGFAKASASVLRQARNTVAPLGTLVAYRYAGRAVFAPGARPELVFSMTFDSAAEAAGQASLRSRLSTGRFVGRSGQMEEVLAYRSAHVDGSTLTLGFDFDADKIALMSGEGPLLFASCG